MRHIPRIEYIESRIHLTVNLSNGTLEIIGTPDADNLSFFVLGNTTTVTLNGQDDDFATSAIDRLRVTLRGGDDVITGGPEPDPFPAAGIFRGGGGDDRFDLGRGIRVVAYGGSGRDEFICDGVMYGGPGPDIFLGGDSKDSMFGGDGNDQMLGGGAGDSMIGGPGRDTMNGEKGADRVLGGAGNDLIRGQGGNDFLYGNAGNDRIRGGNGDDELWSGTGDDDDLDGNAGFNSLFGSELSTIQTLIDQIEQSATNFEGTV